jgi:hypothetical protein
MRSQGGAGFRFAYILIALSSRRVEQGFSLR